MKIHFIGQGINDSETVGQRLLSSLSNGLFDTFTAISAFISQSAVLGINEILQNSSLKNYTFIVGIDQKGTSKEALEALLLIENADISIIHTTTSIIFHPKIYIFEGEKQCCIIVGSSNLTSSGLFQNIEASLMLEFEMSNEVGVHLLSDINKYLGNLSENRKPLSQELIDSLVESKVVPLEKDNKELRGKQYEEDNSERDPSVWEQIKTVFPSMKRNKIPFNFRIKKVETGEKPIENEGVIEFEIKKGALVWQKHNLPPSDAQQVKGNTNVTGVLRLGQADFRIDGNLIDKNTYFREIIFGDLDWQQTPRKNNTPLQEAQTEFDILINNQYFGTFKLRISHDPERIAGQANIPTTIHWGTEVVSILKNNNAVSKRLSLYMPVENGQPFTIDIL